MKTLKQLLLKLVGGGKQDKGEGVIERIRRDEELINRSGIREIFTPHRPVSRQSLLAGRERELKSLIEQIHTPGQHSLLYGERGVGKTSLANIVKQIISAKMKVYDVRCDSATTLAFILSEPLKDAGVDVSIIERSRASNLGGTLSVDGELARAQVGGSTTESVRLSGPTITPSFGARKLAQLKGLLVVDEADTLKDEVKKELAELIKLLSDADASFKVMVVGIAKTGADLTAGHPSVARCLRETYIGRLQKEELRKIIYIGAQEANLVFTDSVVEKIVDISAGYPHFTHLLALKSGEQAIIDGSAEVTNKHLEEGLRQAVNDAEGSLKRTYDNAVRSHGTDMYAKVLFAAARIGKTEFTAMELRNAVADLIQAEITQQALNNYLRRLIGEGDDNVLERVAKGVYRFRDPRMPSYIRIVELGSANA